MARVRREWSAIRTDIRRLLREETAATSFWSNAQLLTLFNLSLDQLSLDINDQGEGYAVEVSTTNLEEDQSFYSLPEQCNRVLRVLRVLENGDQIPLHRAEDFSGSYSITSTNAAGDGDSYLPTYRLVGNQIQLSAPPSSDITSGLKIEYEAGRDLIVADSDKIPDDLPAEAESYLIMDTVCAAFAMEGAQGPIEGGVIETYQKRRDEMRDSLFQYTSTRSFGRTFTDRLQLGD